MKLEGGKTEKWIHTKDQYSHSSFLVAPFWPSLAWHTTFQFLAPSALVVVCLFQHLHPLHPDPLDLRVEKSTVVNPSVCVCVCVRVCV